MANTANLVLLSRVLTSSAGVVYASASVTVIDQDSHQPMRVYADAAGSNILSSMGAATTDATGNLAVYVAPGRTLQLVVRGADGTLLDTFSDVTAGDPMDLGQVTLTLSAGRATTAQATVGANTDLVLNSAVAGNTIALDTATGIFTLKAGRTYLITACCGFSTFSDTTGGVATVEIVDGTSNTALVAGRAATYAPPSNTAQVASNGTISLVYAVAAGADKTAKLRCTAATGTASLDVGRTSVTVVAL